MSTVCHSSKAPDAERHLRAQLKLPLDHGGHNRSNGSTKHDDVVLLRRWRELEILDQVDYSRLHLGQAEMYKNISKNGEQRRGTEKARTQSASWRRKKENRTRTVSEL